MVSKYTYQIQSFILIMSVFTTSITTSHIRIVVNGSLDFDHYHKRHLSITQTTNLHYNIDLQYEFHTKTFNNYINILKYLALSVHT